MRAVFSLAVTVVLATSQPLASQDRMPLTSSEPSSTRTRDTVQKPAASAAEKEGAAARARTEARERAWDDKMKRAMRSICSGARGC